MRVVANAALALAVTLAAFAFARWWDFAVPALGGARYQAIFLTNGQAYFAEYRDRLGPYGRIDNAFYIQQTPAQGDQPAQTRIVRRGSELHAPYPVLLVPKTSIVFVEDLAADSPVARFMDQSLGR